MKWLSYYYSRHPEYRRLRRAVLSPCMVAFELEPGLYEAHCQIKPVFERAGSGLWLPAGPLASLGRLVRDAVREPRVAWQMAMSLPWTVTSPYVLQPNAASGRDTELLVGVPTYNTGAASGIVTSAGNASLIGFDVSAIPTSAKLQSAIMVLTQGGVLGSFGYSRNVYSVAIGNKNWIPGNTVLNVAGAGEPCWNALAADGAGGVTTPWAGSAGLATSGTDYESTVIGSWSGNRADAVGTQYSISLSLTRVAGWLGSPNTNYGMKIPNATNLPGMCSSNHATAAFRPMLTVTFSLPVGGVFNPPFAGAFRGPFG